jgi:hypothetical protein
MPVSLIPAASAINGTLPVANGGTGLTSGGPAFSAYRSGSDQTFSTTTWTKSQFNNEYLDTNNCYDSTTNYRFTPNVAGYYLFTLCPQISSVSGTNEMYVQFYKNGSGNNQFALCSLTSGTFNTWTPSVQTIVYMNGTTDYIEAYMYVNGTTPRFNAGGGVFTGALVRSA